MKKGFTLIELLVTIIIIALLSGIGIISYRAIFKTGEERYYNSLESHVLLAGNDYFTDHRDLLPTDDSFNHVELQDLIDSKYIEQTKDSKGNNCSEGVVYVYKENNKYMYEVCLECEGRTSSGKYCNGKANNKSIVATGVTSETNRSYDVNQNYNKAEYVNENVIVTLTTPNMNIEIDRYEAINQKTKDVKPCEANNNTCNIEIEESGTYQVKSYDKKGKHQATTHISVKINRSQSDFSITGKTNFLISENECNGNQKTRITYTIQKDNVNVEYKSLKYRITKENETPGDYKNSNSLTITEELESGHYNLEVEAETFGTGDSQKIKHNKEFNVTYNVKINYDDNTTGTHEVVKGKTYGYINTLPPDKTAWEIEHLEIKYYLNNEQIFDETDVTNSCTYEIEGKMAIPVPIPTVQKLESDYCQKELKYNGSEQTLTIGELDHVIFIDNKGTDASDYIVKAHVDTPKYIWDNGTTSDVEFTCSIGKVTPTISLNAVEGLIATTKTRDFIATVKSGFDDDVEGTLEASSDTESIATVSPTSKSLTATKDGAESGDITITGVDKGTSTITVSFIPTDTKNFNNATKTYTANVRNLVDIPSCNTGLVYTGSSQALIATGTGYTLENNSRTSAGSQDVTVKISDPDTYAWSDNTQEDKTVTDCTIAKKATTSKLSSKSGSYCNNGDSKNITITTDGDGALTCTTSNSSVAACSITNKTLKITSKTGKHASSASATITVKQAAGTNYQAAANLTYKVSTSTCFHYRVAATSKDNCINQCGWAREAGSTCVRDYGSSSDWSCGSSSTVTPSARERSGKYCWCSY